LGLFSSLDDIETSIYRLIGTALFLGIVFLVGHELWRSARYVWFALYCVLVTATIIRFALDLWRGKFGITSRLLVACWFVCFFLVVILFAIAA